MDIGTIRAVFPALERLYNGRRVAYFDGPGGTQVPQMVADAMSDYLLHHNANTHWRYPTSEETDAAIAASRQALADLIGASPDEIAFGANMTTLTFHLARALGRGWGKGDEIVITELDHHANVAPWRALQRERGVTIRSVPIDPVSGRLHWDLLVDAIGPRTRLVAVGAASNALGTITDVAAVTALARRVGALSFVDAVHCVPHALVDVVAMDCDFLACSAYKFYGPHIGILYGKRAVLGALDLPRLDPAPDTPPESLETGTQNHEGIVGAATAVDFLASIGAGQSRRERLTSAYEALHAHGDALVRQLWEGLNAIPGVQTFGPTPGTPRTPTVSFVVAGMPSDDVATALASEALFCSSGDFYATTVIERIGQAQHGVVRAGASCYTTTEEVDRLVHAVCRLATR